MELKKIEIKNTKSSYTNEKISPHSRKYEYSQKVKLIGKQTHYLKVEAKYYKLIEKRMKTLQIRKNDKDYQCGDIVYLRETSQGIETGRILPPKEVTYVFHGGKSGIEKGYCILQLS